VWSRHRGPRHAIEYILRDGDSIKRVFGIIPVVYHHCSPALARVIERAARRPPSVVDPGVARRLGPEHRRDMLRQPFILE
jgi:hypothetical protein